MCKGHGVDSSGQTPLNSSEIAEIWTPAALIKAAGAGWSALAGCLAPEGRLLYVQPEGDAPLAFDPNTTEPFGVGAFLLAGCEVHRMMSPAMLAKPKCSP